MNHLMASAKAYLKLKLYIKKERMKKSYLASEDHVAKK